MKTRILIPALLLLLVAGCKKDDDNSNNSNSGNACNGKNFCMKVDGTSFAEDVVWKVINSSRYRLYWETGTGSSYRNIEIDFYGSIATGTYTVSSNPANSNESGFQYFTAGGPNIQGQSGTVEITSVANDQLSGNFTITAKDQNNNTIEITEGHFEQVPKQ